jgi:UPF0271 protein
VKRIDLNVDIGEGFPFDGELLKFATSANVCCGEHAGSWELTLATIDLCRHEGVRIGMHPGFPDRENMGRVMPPEWSAVYSASLLAQAKKFMEAAPATAYIKPHGAWYNAIAATDETFAVELVDILEMYPIRAMVLPVAGIAHRMPDRVITEGFADRGYDESGRLLPRGTPGAILHDPDEIRAQAMRLAGEVDSICLHGDTPGCVEFAEMLYSALQDAGFEVAA